MTTEIVETAGAADPTAANAATAIGAAIEGGGQPLARISAAVAALLSGLFAGFFVTYQISVTRGLAEVDDLTYVRTFQWINATVQTPEFAVIFFGTVPALAAAAICNRRSGRSILALLVAATILAVATIAITATGNVPLNRELAEFEQLTPELAAVARADFEAPWNTLNLIRTLTAFGAAGCAMAAASMMRVAGR